MTYALMVYLLVVTVLLAAGATLVQSLVRASLPGTRFIWALAMGASVSLLAFAPARLRQPAVGGAAMAAVAAERPIAPARAAAPGMTDLPMSLAERSARALPAWVSTGLGALWFASSVTVLALLALSYRRHRRRIAGAARGTVDGTAVRVTEALGPAVVGVWHPDIVVPRWLLSRSSPEQALVVRHERSHVEVGDPALLLAGCGIAALMPWNPATWYMLAQLRLAIEVDCDRRVLRAGAAPREYGALLIELTSALPALPASRIGAPAFACRPSHLERRLVAMTARPLSHRPARILAAAGVALLALLGACEADLPTAAEVERMDVADVEERVMPVLRLDPNSVTYSVDGIIVPRDVALAVEPERIGNVEVRRDGSAPWIALTTLDRMDSRDKVTSDAAREAELVRRRAVESGAKQPYVLLRDAKQPYVLPPDAKPDEMPTMVIDGVISGRLDMSKLKASEIEEIEVVKGAAARTVYGAAGEKGVIEVTTKTGARSALLKAKVPYVSPPLKPALKPTLKPTEKPAETSTTLQPLLKTTEKPAEKPSPRPR